MTNSPSGTPRRRGVHYVHVFAGVVERSSDDSNGKNFSASGYRCRFDTIDSSLTACPGARAGAHPDVTVHHAGPTIADDGEMLADVMLVLEAPSLDAARAFIADSPFAKADVFADSDIRQFDWITSNPS